MKSNLMDTQLALQFGPELARVAAISPHEALRRARDILDQRLKRSSTFSDFADRWLDMTDRRARADEEEVKAAYVMYYRAIGGPAKARLSFEQLSREMTALGLTRENGPGGQRFRVGCRLRPSTFEALLRLKPIDGTQQVQAFLQEIVPTILARGGVIGGQEFYDRYRSWAQDIGRDPISQRGFSRAVFACGVRKKYSNGVKYIVAGLAPAHAPAPDARAAGGEAPTAPSDMGGAGMPSGGRGSAIGLRAAPCPGERRTTPDQPEVQCGKAHIELEIESSGQDLATDCRGSGLFEADLPDRYGDFQVTGAPNLPQSGSLEAVSQGKSPISGSGQGAEQ